MLKNPVLKYYGSKFRLAKWIIKHFPAHVHYVEPFGGGGSVLMQKSPSQLETYNDADGDVCNFFRVLRQQPDELIRQVRLTPWARNEYEICLENGGDDLENARRLYVRLWMSRHAGTLVSRAAWRRRRDNKSPAADLRPQTIYEAAKRLAHVQIENRDALKLIEEFDTANTLFYCDPPYVGSTRTDKKRYAVEMSSDDDHRKFAETIGNARGMAVVSGYKCDLYREIFEGRGWSRIDTETMANGGVKRTESLWLSPQTSERLEFIESEHALHRSC